MGWRAALISAAAMALLLLRLFAASGTEFMAWDFVILLAFLIALRFSPARVRADGEGLWLHTVLWKTLHIDYDSIAAIGVIRPELVPGRMAGTVGILGFYGPAEDRHIGPFTAFYADERQCFYVRLHEGGQYVVGCADPASMVEHIATRHPWIAVRHIPQPPPLSRRARRWRTFAIVLRCVSLLFPVAGYFAGARLGRIYGTPTAGSAGIDVNILVPCTFAGIALLLLCWWLTGRLLRRLRGGN